MFFNFKLLNRSFKFAFIGLRTVWREEQSFRIQILIGFIVLAAAFYLQLSLLEKLILIFTITMVLSFELINSQIERVLDFLEPHLHPRVKRIKDISAGVVLIICLTAVLIGIMIFLPHL